MFARLMFAVLASFFLYSTAMADHAALPSKTEITATLTEVYQQYKNLQEGKNAAYIPELAKVDPTLFGIAVITVDGTIYSIGDANTLFAIESTIKPFAYGMALEELGGEQVGKIVNANATGRAFNSITALEEAPDHMQNPMVNAGAIQIASLIKGKNAEEKWERMLQFFQALSDGKPFLGKSVYESETATNERNQKILALLVSYKKITQDPDGALDNYTKQCSIMLTAKQLALMGATLANNGVNPLTKKRLFTPRHVRDILSQMAVSGLYENSGDWWLNVGIPAKSGVSGNVLAVIPGKMAIVVYSPPLDSAGNSVRALKVISTLAKKWHLHMSHNSGE